MGDNNTVSMTINGKRYVFAIGHEFGQVPTSETLCQTLRNRLDLTGTKEACSEGACGCCTVIIDGDAVASCITLTVECDGAEITTIEGLQDPVTNELDPIQQAFIDEYAFQCGYCTPGIIMAAKSLLISNPHPTEEEIKEAMSGNYCRCISQYTVLRAINRVAGNGEDHTAVMHRANDDVVDPIPVRQELFPSPFANGFDNGNTLD